MSVRGRVTIVAEAAQGFEGDPSMARMLVRAAAAGRADMVKFQLVYADELATQDYPYYALFKQLEMPYAAWEGVVREAERLGIALVFDVFGAESLRVALELGAAAVKIHSTDFFNEALVGAALERAPKVFFSAGGISVEEIAAFLQRWGRAATKLTLLFGFQAEPTPTADNNLARLPGLRERFPTLRLGFMDHADGDSDEAGWLGTLALAFGVTVIEKHITLDRSLRLEDSVSALNAQDFARYVDRIRVAEQALGSGNLELSEAERAYRRRVLKVVVSARPLPSGATVSEADLSLLRAPPDSGRQTFERTRDVIGRTVVRAVKAGQPVYREDLA
jgi:N,N'-diacetyllegionaminate synthase